MNQKRVNLTMTILVLLVIALLGIIAYAFLIKPAINGYVTNAQNIGIQYTINAILLQIQEKGYVEIPLSANQTLILVPYQNPEQQTGIVG